MAKRRVSPGSPLVAVAYIRVSKDDQKLGPQAQRASIEAWARAQGVVVAAWHADEGICSVTLADERPGLVAALADLRTLGAGVLVVAKRDRLSRDVVLTATIEGTVAGQGAHVVSAAGEGNGEGPADQFMRHVIDAAAQYERALIRARTKAALAAKRTKGERAGCIPYGRRLAPNGKHSLSPKGERRCGEGCAGCLHLEPDPAEQAVIARGKALSDTGLSVRAIAAQLAAEGIAGRTGQPLSHTQVHRFLRPLLLSEAA